MDTDATTSASAASSTFASRAEETVSRSTDLLRRAINSGANYADLFYEHSHASSLAVATVPSTKITSHAHGQARCIEGTGIRAFSGANHSCFSVDGWNPGAWGDVMASAVQDLKGGISAIKEEPACPAIAWFDAVTQDAPHTVSRGEKEAMLSSIIDEVYALEPSTRRCSIEYQDKTRRTLLVNSVDQAIARQQAVLGIRVGVTLRAGDGSAGYATRGYTGSFGNLAFDSPAVIAQEAVDRARLIARTRPMISGTLPVVFAGGWAGLWLHEAVGHLLEADVATDWVAIGRKISVPEFTVLDDPTRSDGQGSYPFDDEGIPAQRTVLINEGRVENLLMDRFHASRLQIRSTGNGRRAQYTDLPLPRMTNLCLQSSTNDLQALLASVKDGLYVKQAAAGVQRRDTGAFEIKVLEGYRIEAGRLTHPVQDVVVAGECLPALRNIRGIGNDAEIDRGLGICNKAGQTVPVSISAPSVLIDALDVRQC